MVHLIEYWYYHLPNYLLAALLWTMVARLCRHRPKSAIHATHESMLNDSGRAE